LYAKEGFSFQAVFPEVPMKLLTSRKNQIITHLKKLSEDGSYRREMGEYICDGEKLLKEAFSSEAEISCVLCAGEPDFKIPETVALYSCSHQLIGAVSPLKNSKGPVFSVKMPNRRLSRDGEDGKRIKTAVVLENVQDPGNVGTVVRTANAMDIDAVILVGDCADIFHPKTVRATMGGVFRQTVMTMDISELKSYLERNELSLFGATLNGAAKDIRDVDMRHGFAAAVGSEGRGLSEALLEICVGELIIPMRTQCESLNAAVAASIIIWEIHRRK
jgi:TrmH family RNA methyltransferase